MYSTPEVSGYNTSLGEKYYPFKLTYSIHDKFTLTSLTIIEKIDNLICNIRANSIRDNVYELDLTEIWYGLSDGLHTISITVTDERGGSDIREYKFYKGNSSTNVDSINLIKHINK